MWIVFGATALRREHGNADRFCLTCRKVMAHGLISEQGWFTLFFVPVIPLGPRLFRVSCGLCSRQQAEQSRPMPRWTLTPRQGAARFWGWLFTSISLAWFSLMVLAFVGTNLGSDPEKKLELVGLLLVVLLTVAPPLTLGLLCFRKATRLQQLIDKPLSAEEQAALIPPKGEAQLQAYVQRLEKQAHLAELTQKRLGFLLLGWLTLVTCLLSTLSPFFFWKAHKLKKEIATLEQAA